MKKCAACQNTYSDDTMRCPECGLFLIPDLVSDLDNNHATSRRTFTRRTEGNTASEPTQERRVRPSSTLKPGERIGSTNSDTIQPSGRNHGVRTSPRQRGWLIRLLIRLRPYLRYIIPSILIIVAAIIIVINWAAIKPVLTCIGVGAIIGGGVAIYLTRRHFNPDAVTAGAIIGAILACVFQYNILDIGTELGALLYALGPVCIMLLGIGYMLRSIWRD